MPKKKTSSKPPRFGSVRVLGTETADAYADAIHERFDGFLKEIQKVVDKYSKSVDKTLQVDWKKFNPVETLRATAEIFVSLTRASGRAKQKAETERINVQNQTDQKRLSKLQSGISFLDSENFNGDEATRRELITAFITELTKRSSKEVAPTLVGTLRNLLIYSSSRESISTATEIDTSTPKGVEEKNEALVSFILKAGEYVHQHTGESIGSEYNKHVRKTESIGLTSLESYFASQLEIEGKTEHEILDQAALLHHEMNPVHAKLKQAKIVAPNNRNAYARVHHTLNKRVATGLLNGEYTVEKLAQVDKHIDEISTIQVPKSKNKKFVGTREQKVGKDFRKQILIACIKEAKNKNKKLVVPESLRAKAYGTKKRKRKAIRKK